MDRGATWQLHLLRLTGLQRRILRGLLLQLGGYGGHGWCRSLGDLDLDAVVLVGERDVAGRPLAGPTLRIDHRVASGRVRVAQELLVVGDVTGGGAGRLGGGGARATRTGRG